MQSAFETFTSLIFVMGVVIQLPLIMFVLAKMGFVLIVCWQNTGNMH